MKLIHTKAITGAVDKYVTKLFMGKFLSIDDKKVNLNSKTFLLPLPLPLHSTLCVCGGGSELKNFRFFLPRVTLAVEGVELFFSGSAGPLVRLPVAGSQLTAGRAGMVVNIKSTFNKALLNIK